MIYEVTNWLHNSSNSFAKCKGAAVISGLLV